MCCGPAVSRAGEQRDVQRQADAAVGAARRATAHQSVGGGQLAVVVELQPEDRAVEQRRLVEEVEGLRQREVIDPGDHRRAAPCALPRQRGEVAQPALGVLGVGAAEEHGRRVGRADGRQIGLDGPAVARQDRGQQRLRPSRRLRGIRGLDRDRRDVRVTVGRVDQHVGRAGAPARHRLEAMAARGREPQCRQQPLGRGQLLGVDLQLRERVAAEVRRGGQHSADVEGGRSRRRVAAARVGGLLEQEQGAHRVDRHAIGIRLTEDVVEDLQRERPAVARVQHPGQEVREVEAALAGEAAVVPAPLQDVHPQPRGVGQLQEEDLLARDLGDRREVGRAREDVEAVQADAQGGVIGALHDAPAVVVLRDVAPPRERLVGDPQAAIRRAGRELVQLLGGEVVVVDGLLADVRAHEHRGGAERLHHVELRLGAAHVRGQGRRCDRFVIAKRLVEVDRQPEL